MAWVYEQSSGKLSDDSGNHISTGYSGFGSGKNNPSSQSVHDVGPLPVGEYEIGTPRDTQSHGPFVLPLTPAHETDTFERSGFLIHGDSIKAPGTASHGCLIFARVVRELIWNSGIHQLKVV